ncbi:MAG TPA: phytoene/squalene synthase family protein [Candidatus Aquilonibacter sp.]|nr:phytoene/squalene synthase family protein [Candidatus Aquilonibacter sp.]
MSAARAKVQLSELEQAYATCREIAKREAKNFYWAFRVLPQHKSDAMCAVYAFMRKADDLADDESVPIEARRAAMATWTAEWRAARGGPGGGAGQDPVFVALDDAQRRFGISDELLEKLVEGTTLDLQEQQPGVEEVRSIRIIEQGHAANVFQVYRTFEDLYRYCYLVASVVGLVCIRIFGYTDEKAEHYAEHVGIAFQLTNILRDVKEDAERGRVYLPLAELEHERVELDEFLLATRGVVITDEMVELVRREVKRAGVFYRDAAELIPLLDADARPAMRVLVGIYERLLDKIAANPAAVFHRRVSVPTATKLAILARGMFEAWRLRRRAA